MKTILLCLIPLLSVSHSLLLGNVTVPPFRLGGDSADLGCNFSLLSGEQLYSVKWYKGGQEIFRFIPGNKVQTAVFPQPGLNIDQVLKRK